MKKYLIIILIITTFIFTNIAYAGDYQDIYQSLKDDYPTLIDRMTNNGAANVTEDQIMHFLDDLGNEMSKKNLTEDNFDFIMYDAVKDILFVDGILGGEAKLEHKKFTLMLSTEFWTEITEATETKTLTGDLKGLNEAVKDILLQEEEEEEEEEEDESGSSSDTSSGSAETEEADSSNESNKIIANADALKATVEVSSGQVEVTLTQNNILKNIETQIENRANGENTQDLHAVLDLKLSKSENAQKIQLPSLDKVFEKVNKLSIETDLGTIVLEKDSLFQEQLTKSLDFTISKSEDVYDIELEDSEATKPTFNKPVIVSLPYILESGKDSQYVSVVYIDENGNETPMGGVYKNGRVQFFTNHFSKYKVVYASKSFEDIANIAWAKDKIEALTSKGIINGRNETTFDPNANITRAEFTALVIRSMKLKGNLDKIPFSDISSDAWYADYIAAAYENGIIKGRTEAIFDPDSQVTIEEALVTLARIMNAKGYKQVDYNNVAIDNISSWAKDEIGTALYNKLQKDIPTEDFVPTNAATRAQISSIVYEFYNKVLGAN